MAKNFKLHIKNSQLAEAINLRGLKAKLSKKKTEGDDEHEELMQENLDSSGETGKRATKKKAASEKKETDHIVSSTKKKQPEEPSSNVQDPEGQKEKKQEKVLSATKQPQKNAVDVSAETQGRDIPFQEKKEKADRDEIYPEEPTFSTIAAYAEEDVHTRAPQAESDGSREAVQTKKDTSLDHPPAQKATADLKKSEEKKTGAASGKQQTEEKKAPLFLSASRDNPDQLGPVLDKKLPPERPAPRSYERQQDRPQPSYQDRYQSRGQSQRDGGSDSARGGAYERRPFQGSSPQPRSQDYPRERREGGAQQRYGAGRPHEGRRPYEPRPSGGQGSEGYRPSLGGAPHRSQGFRSGGPGGGMGPGRRFESGFKPQPFVSRAPQDAAKQPGWDRGASTKEGSEDRAASRRHTSLSSSAQEEKKGKSREKEGKGHIKRSEDRGFDSRLRHGFQAADDDDASTAWRKKRAKNFHRQTGEVQEPSRPTKIKVRLPISVKDLAQEMKLKASQLISKLFLQGIVVTLNDPLDDETVVQLLGHEFGCEVAIDTSEQEKLKLSQETIREEIALESEENLKHRPPIIAFMGHVDHGKTSLIDAIRKTNRVQGEVGAITQHVGAFSCTTSHGPITILDTPGHEAFSAMRERGAEITDIVVLVIAGDEGMKDQTLEALNQARDSDSTIIVAINKCDKPNFDQEKVYRQLADNNLLPEAWGGQTITVNCSAITGVGIQELLEMAAIQSEVLELKANPNRRARGTVIESEMHKGLGPVATVIVQNGTLKVGDCLIFDYHWAKVKSMRDDSGKELLEAGPSTPVRINGLSGFPAAGEEFVVVGSEKEARQISEARQEGKRQLAFQPKKKISLESMAEKAGVQKKVLNLILRADVQGSLEALKTALLKIKSKKVEVNIVSMSVGEISESDIQLAAASKSTIVGFHTQVESHAEPMIKEMGVDVRLHNIIYHAQDDVRELMKGLLDKIAQETDKGKAEVKATFKSSQLGIIAGCQVIDGIITRNCSIRVVRAGDVIWKGSVASLKRFKDDVKEVTKGNECGVVLNGFSDFMVGDILEAYETTYLTQEL